MFLDSRRNDFVIIFDCKKLKRFEYVWLSIEIKEYFILEVNNILLRIIVDIIWFDMNEIINVFLNFYNYYKLKGLVIFLI